MAGTSKNPSSNSGKSNGAPGAALVYVKCGYTVCQFAHASGVTPPPPHVSHLKVRCRDDTHMPKTVDTRKHCKVYRVESMQQSSATPSLHIVACSQPYLAVLSCIYSFWHGVIPTSYFIFNTCCVTCYYPYLVPLLFHSIIPTSRFIFNASQNKSR